jgi:uncharacterized protein (DUF2336 family)
MSTILPADILVELESAIAGRPPDRCARMLWQTTELLVAGHGRLHEQEIGVLDEVLMRLAERIDAEALVHLSAALVDLQPAPRETLRWLAFHEDPTVAAPLLLKSQAISDDGLQAIAACRGEQHLLAIAGRSRIGRTVAETLLKHGGKNVVRALVKNPGAQFSQAGHALLLAKAEGDAEIATALALRPDTPDPIMHQLIAKAPKEVRTSILEAAPSGLKQRLEGAIAPAAKSQQPPLPKIDYSEAKAATTSLARIGKLNDSTVNRFAIRGETANLVASLSLLSGAPIEIIERVMADSGYEGLVMACRASRLNWQTALAILNNRSTARLTLADRGRAQQLFDSQYLSTSQWMVRWGDMPAGAGTKLGDSNVATTGVKR